EIPTMPEWDRRTKLAFEKEMLGLYVSDHPLRGVEAGLAEAATHPVSALVDPSSSINEGTSVTVAGLLTGLARKATKGAGKLWATCAIEDLDASIEVLFFPAAYDKVAADLAEDRVVAVTGRLVRREERPVVHGAELTVLALAEEAGDAPVVITMPAHRVTQEIVDQLQRVLRDHPGRSEVRLRVVAPGKSTLLSLNGDLRVDASGPLFADLKASFGLNCVA
ncbi:MAG: OB-fold nucleic acid binding domain-containing protein, partial [Micrococcales bacterium]|nr:OB-fold nucleic acid binding domain-containing protein [Micrococcales bacterium]